VCGVIYSKPVRTIFDKNCSGLFCHKCTQKNRAVKRNITEENKNKDNPNRKKNNQ
jgi:hypothetical protein